MSDHGWRDTAAEERACELLGEADEELDWAIELEELDLAELVRIAKKAEAIEEAARANRLRAEREAGRLLARIAIDQLDKRKAP